MEEDYRQNMEYLYLKGTKHVYVMLNHRVAYLCWMDAIKRGFIKPKAFLTHIDWHTDFQVGALDLITKNAAISNDDEACLEQFVKNELQSDNSNFIVPAMYRGVIGDALSIDRQDNHEDNYGDFKKMTYETTNRAEFIDNSRCMHTFYFGSKSITDLVGYNGLLTDRLTHLDVHKAFDKSFKERNMILDFDLDYFTYEENGRPWALNERNLRLILWSEGFDYLLNRANIITIALEPACCGGSTECLNILARLCERLQTVNRNIGKLTLEEFKKELVG